MKNPYFFWALIWFCHTCVFIRICMWVFWYWLNVFSKNLYHISEYAKYRILVCQIVALYLTLILLRIFRIFAWRFQNLSKYIWKNFMKYECFIVYEFFQVLHSSLMRYMSFIIFLRNQIVLIYLSVKRAQCASLLFPS